MLTQQYVGSLNENDLRKLVIMPLLRAMNFCDVFEMHGVGEQGKDIVCWKSDELGTRVNYAIVAKAVRLSGRASSQKGSANEVRMQVQQCFGTHFLDPVHGSEQNVHQVWVISNKESSKEARGSLKSGLMPNELERSVRVIDGDMLWKLIERYLPEARLQGMHETGMWLDSLDSHYRISAKASGPRITFGLEEKFPGAAQEKPLSASARFDFPDTEEGRAAREAFKQHIATGAPVEIPAPFAKFALPDFMQGIFGNSSAWKSIHLGPVMGPQSLLVRIEIQNDDGDSAGIEYVDLKETQGGTDEVTFANDHQPIPEQVKLVLDRNTGLAHFTMSTRQFSLNVKRIFDSLRMQQAMSRGGILRFIHLDSGLRLLEVPIAAGNAEPPDVEQMEAIEDLLAIQKKVGRPINLPDRDLTPDEMNLLNKLRYLLHFGVLRNKWENLAITLKAETARQALPEFANGQAQPINLPDSEMVMLFDVELPLGPTLLLAPQGKLANEEEVRTQLERGDDDLPVTMRFVPGDDDSLLIHYLDWVTQSPASEDEALE